MRRTNRELQTNALCSEDHPKTGKWVRRILTAALLLFVVAGVSGIAYFMSVLIPQFYAAQFDPDCALALQTTGIGGSVFLGSYEQDNDLSDGAEPIEWIVLDREDDRVLLISKYALDCVPFNEGSSLSTWDYSTMQTWLNESFYAAAFTPAEKTRVLVSRVRPGVNENYGTDPGEETQSRIFLLSLSEANFFFITSESRLCQPTAYAMAQGAIPLDNGGCKWWLRTPGFDATVTTRVLSDGKVGFVGEPAQRSFGVRPAMWVDCSEVKEA